MIDKLTKLLLAAIAAALWTIAMNPWLRPMPVAAQGEIDLSNVEAYLSNIESGISSTQSDVSSIESYLGRIQRGTCLNSKIC